MEYLPPEIWFSVFERVTSQERRCSLPLVCQAFRQVLCQPSSLWHNIAVDLDTQQPTLRAPAQQWFKTRAAQLTSLQLNLPAKDAGFAADVLAALGNDPPLRRLLVDFNGAEAQYVSSFLAQLAWLRQLRALRISGLQGPIGSTQLFSLRHLVHLRALDLAFADSGPPQLPAGFPSAILALTKLCTLHISSAGEYAFRIMPMGLSRLQNLREIGLRKCGAHGFCLGFTGMTSLETLTVIDPSPPRHMKFPRNMAAMVSLQYVDVACREVPVPLGSLPSLKHLTLRGLRPSCRKSHDAEKDFASLLEHLSLESLSLLNSRLGSVPNAVTYHSSLQSLAIRDCFLTHLSAGPYLLFLKYLDLTGNDFWSIPHEAMQAPMLESITMLEGVAPLDLRAKRCSETGKNAAFLQQLQEVEGRLGDLHMHARLCRDDDVLLHGSSLFLDKGE